MEQCIRLVSGAVRWLHSERESLSPFQKFFLAVAAMPVFVFAGLIFLWQRFRGTPHHVIGRSRQGVQFHCALPDIIQSNLYFFGIWEPDLTSFIERRLAPGDVFLDIGANIGYYTLVAAKLAGPDGKAVAVEVSPTIFALLQENLALNGSPENVRAVNVAAAAERGTLPVYRGPSFNIGITSTVKTLNLTLECEIDAVPVAELLEPDELRRLKLVKIDIEGAEEHVLPSLGEFLASCPEGTEFLIELTPLWWKEKKGRIGDVLAAFSSAGYHFYRIQNSYAPWRYLWPLSVHRPVRIRGEVKCRFQIDLVVSRTDADYL